MTGPLMRGPAASPAMSGTYRPAMVKMGGGSMGALDTSVADRPVRSYYADNWSSPVSFHSPNRAYTSPNMAANSFVAPSSVITQHHGKLHKRMGSAASGAASSIESYSQTDYPPVGPLPRAQTVNIGTFDNVPEPYDSRLANSPHDSKPSASKLKPYLRKMSNKEGVPTLDLSKRMEDQELYGLGLYDESKSTSEVSFNSPVGKRHGRSTSINSVGSSSLKPTAAPFAHHMRSVTARSYTPPVAGSNRVSMDGENDLDGPVYTSAFPSLEASDDLSRPETATNTITGNGSDVVGRSRRSTASSSVPGVGTGAGIMMQKTGSSSRLASNTSQSNLSSTVVSASDYPIPGRARGYTDTSMSARTPSSRTSFDKTFSKIRSPHSNKDSPLNGINDANLEAARAAEIRKARKRFTEREEAKTRRREHDEQKKQKRRERKLSNASSTAPSRIKTSGLHDKSSRNASRDELAVRSPASLRDFEKGRPVATSTEQLPTGSALASKEYSSLREPHAASLPTIGRAAGRPASRGKTTGSATGPGGRNAKRGAWWKFMTWLKTRLFRVGLVS